MTEAADYWDAAIFHDGAVVPRRQAAALLHAAGLADAAVTAFLGSAEPADEVALFARKDEWAEIEPGPRGGRRWQNARTGTISYKDPHGGKGGGGTGSPAAAQDAATPAPDPALVAARPLTAGGPHGDGLAFDAPDVLYHTVREANLLAADPDFRKAAAEKLLAGDYTGAIQAARLRGYSWQTAAVAVRALYGVTIDDVKGSEVFAMRKLPADERPSWALPEVHAATPAGTPAEAAPAQTPAERPAHEVPLKDYAALPRTQMGGVKLPDWASKESKEVAERHSAAIKRGAYGAARTLHGELEKLLAADRSERRFNHGMAVRDAVAAGQGVPDAVLADYPQLAAQVVANRATAEKAATELREPPAGGPLDQVFSTGQAGRLLNVPSATVSKWFDQGRLRGYRVPGTKDRRIPARQLLSFMAEHNFAVPPELAAAAEQHSAERADAARAQTPAATPTPTPEPTPTPAPVETPATPEPTPAAPEQPATPARRGMFDLDHPADVPLPRRRIDTLLAQARRRSLPGDDKEGRLHPGAVRLLREDGFFTDGRMLVKLRDKELARALELTAGETEDRGTGRRADKFSVADVTPARTHPEPAAILGAVPEGRSQSTYPEYVLQDGAGRRVRVRADLVKAVSDRYPDATMHLSPSDRGRKNNGPIVFHSGGKLVGLVMPLAHDDDDLAAYRQPPARLSAAPAVAAQDDPGDLGDAGGDDDDAAQGVLFGRRDEWTEEKGPRGGRIWRNARTGKTTRKNPGGDAEDTTPAAPAGADTPTASPTGTPAFAGREADLLAAKIKEHLGLDRPALERAALALAAGVNEPPALAHLAEVAHYQNQLKISGGRDLDDNYRGTPALERSRIVLEALRAGASPASPASPAATGHWLDDAPQREAVLATMRSLRDRADRSLAEYQKLAPRQGEVAVGGAHFDAYLQGAALGEFLRRLNRGETPEQAADGAAAHAREMVRTWNRNPQATGVNGTWEVQRWEEAADGLVRDAARRVAAAAEPRQEQTTAQPAAATPAADPAATPDPRTLDQLLAASGRGTLTLGHVSHEGQEYRLAARRHKGPRGGVDFLISQPGDKKPAVLTNMAADWNAADALGFIMDHKLKAGATFTPAAAPAQRAAPARELPEPFAALQKAARGLAGDIGETADGAAVFKPDRGASPDAVGDLARRLAESGYAVAWTAAGHMVVRQTAAQPAVPPMPMPVPTRTIKPAVVPQAATPTATPAATPGREATPTPTPTPEPTPAATPEVGPAPAADLPDPRQLTAASELKARGAGWKQLAESLLNYETPASKGFQPPRYSFAGLLHDTGIYSDGRVMLRLPPEAATQAQALLAGRYDATKRHHGGQAADMLARSKAHAEAATVIGAVAHRTDAKIKPAVAPGALKVNYVLQDSAGRRASVDGAYVELARRHYPDATFHLAAPPASVARPGTSSAGPVVVKSGGATVGIIMPHDYDHAALANLRPAV